MRTHTPEDNIIAHLFEAIDLESRLALADAARQAWTLSHPVAIFAAVDDYLSHSFLC
jgi:hypothetical protein